MNYRSFFWFILSTKLTRLYVILNWVHVYYLGVGVSSVALLHICLIWLPSFFLSRKVSQDQDQDTHPDLWRKSNNWEREDLKGPSAYVWSWAHVMSVFVFSLLTSSLRKTASGQKSSLPFPSSLTFPPFYFLPSSGFICMEQRLFCIFVLWLHNTQHNHHHYLPIIWGWWEVGPALPGPFTFTSTPLQGDCKFPCYQLTHAHY